jgi:hypothetical protein
MIFESPTDNHEGTTRMLLATVIGLLALISFISLLLSGDDSESRTDPRDQLPMWARFGHS